jgi:hypothetical protein
MKFYKSFENLVNLLCGKVMPVFHLTSGPLKFRTTLIMTFSLWSNHPPLQYVYLGLCATALSITTFSITTLSIMTLSIMTLSIMTLSVMTLSITINKMQHSA